MGAFAKRDIVLYPFPYTDLSNRKFRPCLVLSGMMQDDIILCQITSQHSKKDAYVVELSGTDTLDGGLQVDSFIRANMIFTVASSQIVKRVCTVSPKKYIEIIRIITKLIS